jgi:hypothetical protein
MPVGLILRFFCWGLLFWYYLEVIRAATFEGTLVAEVYLGDDMWERVFNMIKGLWVFAFGLLLTMLPYSIWLGLTRSLDMRPGLVGAVLNAWGLLTFPVVILNYGINRDISMLARVDLMIKPVLKALLPYLMAAGMLILTWQLFLCTKAYAGFPRTQQTTAFLHLGARLLLQLLAIISMLAIGLFYRHYYCYFDW